ncbi:LPS translocon maturation chaperone LptM [Paraburkholderia acidipaludis]|uniref:LPS translocon maturation chaperone LptM n=1 Tax=Paraburkholderia acidipaludis TaxID=660537 RepID=UPI000482A1A3|nr:lipoprotein [Paraburkholderia acidipaludis]
MRVISRMRAVAPGAILAISAVFALVGCGQRGALYMPTVPPLPPKPNFETQDTGTTAPEAASAASGVEAGSIPDTSGTPLSLSPDTELSTTPTAPASPQPASSATPTQ